MVRLTGQILRTGQEPVKNGSGQVRMARTKFIQNYFWNCKLYPIKESIIQMIICIEYESILAHFQDKISQLFRVRVDRL